MFSNLKYKIWFLNNFLPWIFNSSYIKNQISFLLKILTSNKNCKLQIKNYTLKIDSITSSYRIIIALLKILRFSISFEINENGKMKITFDNISFFIIDLEKLTITDQKLILLLSDVSICGITAIDQEKKASYFLDNKCIYIDSNMIDNEIIIETYDNVKFFLKYYNFPIIETFYNNVLEISTLADYKNKIVFDIGASIGETALYFSNKGAKVYAVEMDDDIFPIISEHMKINPHLSESIYPLHAALAHDGEIEYTLDPEHFIDSTIFNSRFDDYFNKGVKKTIKSYSIDGLMKLYKLDTVDYLKIDCKGCEFTLTKKDLENVQNLKIEYMKIEPSHDVLNLVQLIKDSGFQLRIFNHEFTTRRSIKKGGNILATKSDMIST